MMYTASIDNFKEVYINHYCLGYTLSNFQEQFNFQLSAPATVRIILVT